MMTSHDCGDDDDNDDGCVNGQALFRASFPDCHTAIGEGVCVLVSECILIAGSWGLNGGPNVHWPCQNSFAVNEQPLCL